MSKHTTLLPWKPAIMDARGAVTIPCTLRRAGAIPADSSLRVTGDDQGHFLLLVKAGVLGDTDDAALRAVKEELAVARQGCLEDEESPLPIPGTPPQLKQPVLMDWEMVAVDGKGHLSFPPIIKTMMGIRQGAVMLCILCEEPDGAVAMVMRSVKSNAEAVQFLKNNKKPVVALPSPLPVDNETHRQVKQMMDQRAADEERLARENEEQRAKELANPFLPKVD